MPASIIRRTKALESTAYHEAGHAAAVHKHQIRTKVLSIVPDETSTGRIEHHPYFGAIDLEYDLSPRVQRRIENMAFVCLAGPAAQRRFNRKGVRHYHGEDDRRLAIYLLERLVGSSEELEAYLNLIQIRVRNFVGNHVNWFFIDRVAQALIERRTLTGAEVRELMLIQPGDYSQLRETAAAMAEDNL